MRRFIGLFVAILVFLPAARAQTAEVTITLNEQFFDSLLDAVFTNLKQPSFPIASKPDDAGQTPDAPFFEKVLFTSPIINNPECDESIRLQRETDGVRTAVHFQDGKIYAPIAFSGSYNPPLIGCIDFEGFAESNIELEFDRQTQTLVGRATVLNVRLSGAGGIGSSLIAKIVQGSIDRKINPIKIIEMEKVSFVIPVQNSGSLRMKATDIRHDLSGGALNVHITYQFLKG